MRILIMSTPVGPLGSGLGGGVELTVRNLAQALVSYGHDMAIAGPKGSVLDNIPVIGIEGNLQITAQTQDYRAPIMMPENSVLGNMWDYARSVQGEYDVIFNIAFDWLPFYLTPFFHKPIAHFISMGSLIQSIDQIMEKVARDFPNTVGVCSQTQAHTFTFADRCVVLGGGGIDLDQYQFNHQPERILGWLGRISPEKALEDGIEASIATGIPLRIMGKVQDQAYWQGIQEKYRDASMEYLGFLNTQDLQREVGKCLALLMTPRWVEAFGLVAIESMACGVPVIAYDRGGPREIISHGKTGFLVKPDSIDGLVEAIAKIDQISRLDCREAIAKEHSLQAWGQRMNNWLISIC
jgi:UDP-glucose:tetrahydrobiopterin glucosyltransferase